MFEKALGRRGLLLGKMFGLFLISFALLRLLFFYVFRSKIGDTSEVLKAFYLGLKFDTRVVLVLLLLPGLGMLIPNLNPFQNRRAGSLWTAYAALCFAFSLCFYALDFGYFSYLGLRVNASIIQFFENPLISAGMVWQSYPVVTILLGILATAFFLSWIFWMLLNKSLKQAGAAPGNPLKLTNPLIAKGLQASLVVILFVGGLYGKLSAYPLRWSEAYFSTNSFISSLGMNPIHYFFDTLENRETPYDISKVKKYYPLVADYLGVDQPNAEKLNFDRWLQPRPQLPAKTNIVLIIMESFAAHKTGILGHPLNTTPHFDEWARKGKLFRRFHVPSEGTARSIFGLITGIPDVNSSRTSSRNPLIVDQHTLINAFTDHQKFYFLGGSANWGNIRGVISSNIPDMKLFEEGMYTSQATDVWGINDYQLFDEVHQQLNSLPADQSFFTIVQTAGFHRPYTIPEGHDDFQIENLDGNRLSQLGFVSNEEYNSLRFSDFSLGHFMNLAKESKYFDNTLFVVIGDHGLPDLGAAHLSPGERFYHLTRFHVPLLMYHPHWGNPEFIDTLATEPDVLVSLASLTGHKTLVRNLGRDLWDPRFNQTRYAFHYVYYRSPPHIALLDDQYYLLAEPSHIMGLFDVGGGNPEKDLQSQLPERTQMMSDLTFGLYETARYLLYNNPNPLKTSPNLNAGHGH